MAALTDAEKTVYRERLRKAEIAYDALMTGKSVKRFVDQNGETVEYTSANADRLAAYIESLKQLLDCNRARARALRPLRFFF